MPLVTDTDLSIEISGFAALALGLVFTSTCKEEIVTAVLQALMVRYVCACVFVCVCICVCQYGMCVRLCVCVCVCSSDFFNYCFF